MQVVFLIIIGAAAGFIATRLMKLETGVLTTIAIGVLGALIGGVVLRFLLVLTGIAAGFVGAVLGAALLIWLYRIYLKSAWTDSPGRRPFSRQATVTPRFSSCFEFATFGRMMRLRTGRTQTAGR